MNRYIFPLLLLFSSSLISKDFIDREKRKNIENYLKNGIKCMEDKESIHIYLLQSIKCVGCAEHNFENVTKNENPNIKKLAIVTSPIKKDFQSMITNIPNTTIYNDTSYIYGNYDIFVKDDIFVDVKAGKIGTILLVSSHKFTKYLRRKGTK